jgi:hypothetical protein
MRELRARGFLSKSDDHVDGSISEQEYTLHDCDPRKEKSSALLELYSGRSRPLLEVQGSLSRAGSGQVGIAMEQQ